VLWHILCHSSSAFEILQFGHQVSSQRRGRLHGLFGEVPFARTFLLPAHVGKMHSSMKESAELCPLCNDTGWKAVIQDRDRRVTRCDCRLKGRAALLMKAARIPARYEHCELSEFDTQFDGAHPSLQKALLGARRFLEDYPVDRTGLVLTGPVGTGKTHLAVGIMKELIRTKQIDCKFYEYRDLLKEIQNSYDPSVSSSENSILKPVFECEILVIDEIGAMRSTEWVEEMVGFVLNTRYNDQKTVVLTTNFPDLPAATPPKQGEAVDVFQAKMAARRHTLGDRLTDRMRSRLHEMCRFLNMDGPDVRMKFRSANFR
jgi:DNA replication protein DnaC